MFSNSRTDLYTLYLLLFALLIFPLLAFQVFVLSVVDNLAYGWLGSRRNKHEVEPLVSSHLESLAALHDSKLLTFRANDSNVAILQNSLIDLRTGLGARRPSKSCYVVSPRMFAFVDSLVYLG